MFDLKAEKRKLRKRRKQRRQAEKCCVVIEDYKFISNLAEADLPKIRRLFDPVIGLPRAVGCYTVDSLVAEGIIGLYIVQSDLESQKF